MELIYDEIVDKLDIKYIGQKATEYTLPACIIQISDSNLMKKSSLPVR